MILNCEVVIPRVEGLEDGVLTVGRVFSLDCKSTEDLLGDFAKSQLELAAEQKYALNLLKVQSTNPKQIVLDVTSYKAGEWKFEKVFLKQEAQSVELHIPPLVVKTVIEQSQQEKPESFGPIGPLKIPWLYICVLLVIVLYIIGVIVLKVRRYSQRKALLAHLQDFETAMAPLQQFHASSRKWQRDYTFFHSLQGSDEELKTVLQDMDRLVRVYFIRKYQIPAHQWGRKLILKELKKEHRSVYNTHSDLIQKWFLEIERALSGTAQRKAEDVIQLNSQARKLLEKLDHQDRSEKVKSSTGFWASLLDLVGLG